MKVHSALDCNLASAQSELGPAIKTRGPSRAVIVKRSRKTCCLAGQLMPCQNLLCFGLAVLAGFLGVFRVWHRHGELDFNRWQTIVFQRLSISNNPVEQRHIRPVQFGRSTWTGVGIFWLLHQPTRTTCCRLGPCAPSCNVCSMSPVRDGPVIMLTVRGKRPSASRQVSRRRAQASS